MRRMDDERRIGQSGKEGENKSPKETAHERLSKTLDHLWNSATSNLGGRTTKVQRFTIQQPDLEPLELDLIGLMSEKDVEEWKKLSQEVLVEPPKKFKGLAVREGNIQRQTVEVQIAGGLEKYKYSYTSAIFDHSQQADNVYPPDPYKGRPQVKIGSLDIYKDSRADLEELHGKMSGRNKSAAEEINRRVKQAVLGIDQVRNDPLIGQVITDLEQTPLTAISIVARKTYYDKEKDEWQPVNTAGILIYDDLSPQVNVSRLAPWDGHNSWEQLDPGEQLRFAMHYDNEFHPTLDRNLRKLGQFIEGK